MGPVLRAGPRAFSAAGHGPFCGLEGQERRLLSCAMTKTLRHATALSLSLCVLLGVSAPGLAQSFEDRSDHSPPYRLFLPPLESTAMPIPLLVMLHGCNQDALEFAEVTRMNALAATEGFAVLYPEQRTHPTACWRWYEPEHQARGRGEPAAIVGLVEEVMSRSDLTIDPSRIHVAGLSAGAGMAAILGAAYADVFAAIGVVAGLPYGIAEDCLSAFNAMQRISDRLPSLAAWSDYWQAYGTCLAAGEANPLLSAVPAAKTLGERAFETMGPRRRILPVVVFHGTADRRVFPANEGDLVTQWAQTNDLAANGLDDDDVDDTAESERLLSFRDKRKTVVRSYETDLGEEVIRSFRVEGMAHAWPGGAPGKPFSDPRAPDASRLIWGFLSRQEREPLP